MQAEVEARSTPGRREEPFVLRYAAHQVRP
jgi:hypothetical protein